MSEIVLNNKLCKIKSSELYQDLQIVLNYRDLDYINRAYMQGFTDAKIADLNNCHIRTVEHYVVKLKAKFRCTSSKQLGFRLGNYIELS